MAATIFLVERYIPRLSPADIGALAGRLAAATAQMRAEGHEIRWLHSFAAAEDETCLCVFAAETAAAVGEASRRAGAGYERIIPVLAYDAHACPPDSPLDKSLTMLDSSIYDRGIESG
jgi:hypothetical protein